MTKKRSPYKKKPVSEHKTKVKKLEQEALNSIWNRIKLCKTRAEKDELVQSTNPLLKALGDTLIPYKPYLTYAENLNALYIGEKE